MEVGEAGGGWWRLAGLLGVEEERTGRRAGSVMGGSGSGSGRGRGSGSGSGWQ